MTETLNELALFAGAGGGVLGGRLLGWRTVCAVERDPYAAAVLAARQNDGSLSPFPIWDDVCTFDGLPWRGRVDVISGGFPCQDISVAGRGTGIAGERSGLWREFARIIREVGPRYVFVENSPALTLRGLDTVLGDLAALGYDAEWGVLGADDAGAPHVRKRIWIVAHSKNHGAGRWQQQPECSEGTRDVANVPNPIGKRRSQGRPEPEGREGGFEACERGSHVPNADDHRSRLPVQSVGQSRRGESPDVGRDGEARSMANADSVRQLQPQGGISDIRRRAGDSCPEAHVSDANSGGQQAGGLPVGTGAEQPVSGVGGSHVGNANGPGQREQRRTVADEPEQPAAECAGWWESEPQLGRVANGVANRVDRLKAIGNGQVPAVAALAWDALTQRLNGDV